MVVADPSPLVAEVESSTLCDEPSGVFTLWTLRLDFVTPPAALSSVFDAELVEADPPAPTAVLLSLSETPSIPVLRLLELTFELP